MPFMLVLHFDNFVCSRTMPRPAVKRKLSCKSLHEKYQALKDLENGAPNKTVAAKFNVPRNTISTWVKNKDKILKAYEEGNSLRRKN